MRPHGNSSANCVGVLCRCICVQCVSSACVDIPYINDYTKVSKTENSIKHKKVNTLFFRFVCSSVPFHRSALLIASWQQPLSTPECDLIVVCMYVYANFSVISPHFDNAKRNHHRIQFSFRCIQNSTQTNQHKHVFLFPSRYEATQWIHRLFD